MQLEVFLPPLLSLLAGYLLGSIPFGWLLTRLGGGGDIRAVGSGNIGATNVLRTGRRGLAALTLLFDAGKGAAAVLIVEALWPGHAALGAIGALFGHMFPVWLGFRGGKGVATCFGIAAALQWQVALVYGLLWLGVLALTRYSSLAGILAALSAPVAAAALGRFDLVLLFLAFALALFCKHWSNVERLLAGKEPRVGGSGDG